MIPTFDDIIATRLHGFSRWHILVSITILPVAFIPLEFFPQLGLLVPHHNCYQPRLENLSWPLLDILNLSIPQKARPMDAPMPGQHFQPCQEYDLDPILELITVNSTLEEALVLRNRYTPNLTIRTCTNGISFDPSTRKVPFSLSEDMELVCQRKPFAYISSIAYVAGMLVGSLLGGAVTDRIGRRKICLVGPIVLIISGLTTAIAPNIWVFSVLRFVSACIMGVLFISIIILATEWATGAQRNIIGLIGKVYLSIVARGWLVLSVYLTTSWRTGYAAYLACASPAIFGYFIWYESPRWLLTKGRTDEAVDVISRAIRWNRTLKADERAALNDEIMQLSQASERENHAKNQIVSLFRNRKTLMRLLLLQGIWAVNTITFYGLNLNIVRLGTNVYLVSFISGLVGVPSCILQYISYRYFDRKRPIIFYYSLLSALLLTSFVLLVLGYPEVYASGICTVGLLIGEALFTMLYILTPELFPTEVRTTALGLCAASSRVGMMIGAYIETTDESIWKGLPMLVFTCATVVCTILSCFLPRTVGQMEDQTQVKYTHSDEIGTKV